MLMVIFGAGASYDSSPDFPAPTGLEIIPAEQWRPPIANQLFLDRSGVFGDIVAHPNYRKLLPILSRLRRPLTGSIEQELESLLSEATAQEGGDSERKRQLFVVRYYLHDLILRVSNEWLKRTNGVTNYVTLLDQIRRSTNGEPVLLVTFNYDLLLDRALLSFGYKQLALEKELFAHPKFRLLKPHGSVDWARYVDVAPNTRLGIEQIIENANTIKLTKEYLRADATDPHQMSTFGRPIVPAIAIPVQTKTEDTFEWPPSHRATLDQHLPSVTQILIIGWQAKEAHFLKLLREKLPTGGLTQITHLQVIGRDMAEAMNISKQFAADISRNVKNSHHGPTQGGFGHFVAQGLVDFFFK